MMDDPSNYFDHAACGLLTVGDNGRICAVNATLCGWLEYECDQLEGRKKLQDLFTFDGKLFHFTQLIPQLQRDGYLHEIEIDLVKKDGTSVSMLMNVNRRIHASASMDHIALFQVANRKARHRELLFARQEAQDHLTSLRETQQLLRQSHDFLSTALQSVRMGLWSKNLVTGDVWVSDELITLTGWSETSLFEAPLDLLHLIHPEDQPVFEGVLADSIKTATHYNVQFRLRSHPTGSWITVEGRGHAVYAEGGEPLSIFGIIIDISERKAREEQLHQLNCQLALADKRKDEFLATLAHELRNPLAPMRNVLEIMRVKETDDPFVRWSREIIERHVSQMTHLVDDLMESSRISQGRLHLRTQVIDVCELIQHAVETSQALMCEFDHTLIIDKPSQGITIRADSTRIVQIISNLLTNAAKYTPPGGTITLSAIEENDELVLSVRDTGIGIPADQLSHIFTMFSQLTPALERAQGGLGIGLSLVRGLVELHNGTITAKSDGDGMGSEFVVRLPVCKEPPDHVDHCLIQPHCTGIVHSKRILVVDDNVDAAKSLALLLDLNGHTTMSVFDGMAGLNALRAFSPEVILLDIGLPDINGYEVARRIRREKGTRDIMLIAATGWGQEKDKFAARDAGFDCHLTKPINIEELERCIAGNSCC